MSTTRVFERDYLVDSVWRQTQIKVFWDGPCRGLCQDSNSLRTSYLTTVCIVCCVCMCVRVCVFVCTRVPMVTEVRRPGRKREVCLRGRNGVYEFREP